MSSIMKGIVDETELDENLHKWFKEKWVRFGPDGKIRGACARGDDSEGKPKCLPQKKAQNLGKKGRKYAASKKRREDPNPERTGKAKNVATKKNTNEGVPFDECPKCRGPIVHESMMNEKQDACYHKVKSRYKVWPSAYASGALVQCRKKGASNWGNGKKTESSIMKGIVDEASGTPGGLERYRTPAMVNATMQQSLYKRELAPIKAAEKKRKEAEYRKNNPSVSVPSIQIGATNYPIPVIQSWIDNKDLNAALEFAVNKFAFKQSKDFKTELAGDPNFQKAIKNFFNVAEKSLNNRNSTRTKSRWDGKIRAAHRETDISSAGFDAINKINDALLPYYKKYGVDKTGRRVPPNFNYNLEEAKAKQYVKPYNNPQTGEQMGWVSSDGYHKKYWQMFAKASAIKHAKLNPDEVQEDYTGEFAAEKTPAINPYGGLEDNKFRGAISEGISAALNEMPETSGPVGVQPGGWRKYRPKPAGQLEEAVNTREEALAQIKKLSQFTKGRTPGEMASIKNMVDRLMQKFGIKPEEVAAGQQQQSTGQRPPPPPPGGQQTPPPPPPPGANQQQSKPYDWDQHERDSAKIWQTGQDRFKQAQDAANQGSWSMPNFNQPRGQQQPSPFNPANMKEEEVEEDTSYGGGMGQGGNAGQSYRKFKPKSAGTFKEEEQLDEKCWDTHKQVGMKMKGGKSVPNCVPKESAIMKGLKR